MNIDIYNKIKSGGLAMTSPSVGVGNQAISQLNQVSDALGPLESLGVDLAVLNSAKASLSLANASLTGGVSHIASTASDSLRLGSLAAQANRLDALVGSVPSSCFNTEALFATVNGAVDEAFNAINGVASDLSSKIADFISGNLSLAELESALSSIGDELQAGLDSIKGMIDKELALLTELGEKIQASSLAQSIEALWNNPCTQAVLDQTLPSDIKALL